MLEVKNIKINYGGIEAVRDISFQVPNGKIVTLVGANGAGKSSTLRAIVGLVKTQEGAVTFNDALLTGKRTDEIVKQGITLVPEGRHVFPDQTVLENLKIGAYLRSDDLTEDLEEVYSLFPRLKERSWQAATTGILKSTVPWRSSTG